MDEHTTRNTRAAAPKGHAKLGPLSPAFPSADDAARYLHESIGDKRDREYGGVIMQRRSDKLYVATEPVSDQTSTFNFNLILESVGNTGRPVHPEGYELVGGLHSHPGDFEKTHRHNPAWTLEQAKAYMGFFSKTDVILNHRLRFDMPFAYLSGPSGELIRYQASYSREEDERVAWLRKEGSWTSIYDAEGTIEGNYKALAAVGSLRFVVSSPVWGGSEGDVPGDWEPYKPFKAAPMQLPCGPVFPSRDRALNHAAIRISRAPNTNQHVLILQGTLPGQYTTCEPLLTEITHWPDARLLARLPSGFHVDGVYFHSRPLPVQYPSLESWLYKNFITPLELAKHIAQFRRYSPQPRGGSSLYIRLRDGALLRYRFSGSALESQLFAQAPDGQVIDYGWQAELLQGSLLTRDFVRKVAAAGELSVEKTSALWDRSGIVDTDWTPYSQFPLPSLSIAFLSADDAARFVHADMDGQRSQVLGGMILQQRDGRFVVTQPVPTGPRPFAFNGLYPVDRQNTPIILNAGYSLYARFASRVALSLTDPVYVARYKWTRKEAELSAQMFHPQDVADLLVEGRAGYLSGTQDSLIVCNPSTTTSEWRKPWLSDPVKGGSAIAEQLADGTIKPADMVRTLAESGTLRVVVGNALWGPADFVELDWGPWVRALQYQRPATVSHGPIFNSPDAAASDLLRRDPQEHVQRFVGRYFAFILKHEQREEYVASELIPVTEKTPLLSLVSLYGSTLPAGFACHSLYYVNQYVGNGSDAWLKRMFIEPEDLSAAITQARLQTLLPPRGALVYIATPEGALLRYQSPSIQGVFESRSDADTLEQVRAKLNLGTLSPLQFVRRVASSGRLTVVQTSHCWGLAGDVTGLWVPYENLQRRRLSPAFLSMDDAAHYVRRRVPLDLRRPYGGIILRRDDGWFVATEPVLVPDEVFDIKRIFPDEMVSRGLYPPRTTVVASYHSRPARQWPFLLSPLQSEVYSSMFSTRLLAQALTPNQPDQYYYLLAPDGSLVRLKTRAELKYPQVVPADLIMRPNNRFSWLDGLLERRIRSGEESPREYVDRVSKAFEMQVVVGSPMWGEPGPVSGWSPFGKLRPAVRGYREARVDPACSPLHIQADDAARYAHERAGSRDQAQFGYVLKSIGNGHFVATLPVTEDGSDQAHRRVFADAGYPYRYEMGGMYLCGAQWGDIQPGGRVITLDSIFRGLISPSRLKNAMYQVRATAKRAVLPLYLSCADGALLKFMVSNERFIEYQDDLKLKTHRLSPRDYFRRMAAAGELRILVPSANWPGVGVVDAQWQPGRSRGAVPVGENAWAMGPVHAHRDDAAGFVHDRTGSFRGQQAISALLEHTASGSYVPVLATPDDGFPSSVAARLFSATATWPAGYKVSAAYLLFHAGLDQKHSGVERSYTEYFVSWRELGFYLYELKIRRLPITGFYLTARDGALLSYTPTFGQEEANVLATTGKWTAEGGYTALAPAPSHVLSELARLGQLHILRSGSFWTIRTLVHHDLKLPNNTTYRPGRDEL